MGTTVWAGIQVSKIDDAEDNIIARYSYHYSYGADNEPEYGREPVIASVSFGAPRDFYLRQNTDHTKKWSYQLGAGDVLLMEGTCQQNLMHAIPKRKNVSGERINLTFRNVLLEN